MDFGVPGATRVRAPAVHNRTWNIRELWQGITGVKTVLVAEVVDLSQLDPSINLVVECIQQCSELLD